jgi:alkylation response protein AidB-like acyl-CoA dehydrogenase
MSYPLPPSARAWQEKTRRFVTEELIPYEVQAEMTNGELPPGVRKHHQQKAREIGLHALAIPRALGGQALTMLEQTVIQEEIGKVTNALGWCYSSTPPWMVAACSPFQMEKWVKPNIRGERHE